MVRATETASRMIDRAANRQFGLLSSSEFRWYATIWLRDRWIVKIDDLMPRTSLKIETVDPLGNPVAEVSEYLLTPRNAGAKGRPWTQIEIPVSSSVLPDCNGVQVTARFGWTAEPEPIKDATLIQAARIYNRRNSIDGPLSSERVDDIAYTYGAAAEPDTDVSGMIAPFRRLSWVAVGI